ncbi:MAG: glycosyltransferase, partial [Burkholderiaceae bacterium]
MNFRPRAKEEPEINLIPFIDVLLVILIFLMLSTTYSKFTELQLTLPVADAEQLRDHPKEIIVAVAADGRYAINKTTLEGRQVDQVARALAGQSSITLFHAAENRQGAPDLEVLMRADPQITRTVTALGSTTEGILREAAGHKAIVLGASFQQMVGKSTRFGPVAQQLFERTKSPVALVRAWQPETLAFHAPRLRRLTHEDISTRVDRWFAENTFDSHEFADLAALMTLKEKRGVTISVGLPALNEEATVETVIRTLKKALMDDIPLVDEFVLIDSNSTDRTVAIAEECGIPVYRHMDILPEVGTYVGKGEALWKSLHALKGDIIAWVDTDITNIHPRFIYGLLGPLLKYPQVQYVKGFYQRPIKANGK